MLLLICQIKSIEGNKNATVKGAVQKFSLNNVQIHVWATLQNIKGKFKVALTSLKLILIEVVEGAARTACMISPELAVQSNNGWPHEDETRT